MPGSRAAGLLAVALGLAAIALSACLLLLLAMGAGSGAGSYPVAVLLACSQWTRLSRLCCPGA
ncbi:hypothetical protein PABY_13420 [Pyrodictium abyssi]|uniref:Uncharacterized protein n=1 Tax=Pyrodictium abyssi TaxID=54256 RepID=A0ABN6ZSX6_9CREN|nr:hypothetical protein PABY_13420 [Pyrodictium abyssi]